ncbi:Pre-mRNA-splicing factor cwf19 [Microbotryomycetes sp. JL221]|nr:Pre-mRNA-splicing factor cwf19 [Microbotryomycetes sp. JL221]
MAQRQSDEAKDMDDTMMTMTTDGNDDSEHGVMMMTTMTDHQPAETNMNPRDTNRHGRNDEDDDNDDEWVEKDTSHTNSSVSATLLQQPSRHVQPGDTAPVDTYTTFSVDDLRRQRDGRLSKLDSSSAMTDGYGDDNVAASTKDSTLGDLFGDMGSVRQRKPREQKPDPTAMMGQSSRELNKAYWQGKASDTTDPQPPPQAAASSSSSAQTNSPAPGSSGSAWRMSKLRRTYEMAQEEGRHVDEVAIERYGSLDQFREAQQERRILDERDERRKSGVRGGGTTTNAFESKQDALKPKTPGSVEKPLSTNENGASGRRFIYTEAGTSGGTNAGNVADTSRPASRGAFRRPGEQTQAPPSLNRNNSTASSTGAGGYNSSNPQSRPQTPIPSVFTPPPQPPKRTLSSLATTSTTTKVNDASSSRRHDATTSMVLDPDPTSTTTNQQPTLTQSELNKLQAKVIKAKLMNSTNANELEQEYEKERKRRDEVEHGQIKGHHVHGQQETTTDVQMVPTLDGRGRLYDVGTGDQGDNERDDKTRSGRRKKKEPTFESRDRKTGQVLRHNADDDTTSLSELVRQERFSAGSRDQKSMDVEMANRIMTDSRFDNDLEYIDENAERLARRKMKSEVMKKAFAIQDYAKTKKALDSCNMCTGDEGQPPRSAVVAMGTRAYLGLLEHEELVPGHCRIVPIQHHFTSLDADDDTWDEIKNFMKTLMQMNATEHDKGVVFFESCINLKQQRHTCIECVPVSFDLFDELPSYFKEAIDTSEQEWSQHKKRIDFTSSRPFRRSMVSNLPYFMVQFDYKGEKGFGHVIEGIDDEPEYDQDGQELKGELGQQGSGQFPKWFAQEIVGNLIDLEPRKWRKPRRIDFRNNKDRVDKFRKVYSKYDWTRMMESK